MGDTFNLAGILQQNGIDEQQFNGLPITEKNKAFMELIPGYSGLPPQERMKALGELAYPSAVPPPPAGGTGFWSGMGQGIKTLAQPVVSAIAHPIDTISNASDMITGRAIPRMAAGVYQQYENARQSGSPVASSVIEAGAQPATPVDLSDIRQRAQRGDWPGVVGETIPAIAGTVLGGEAARKYGDFAASEPERMTAKGTTNLTNALRPTPGKAGVRAQQMLTDIQTAKPDLSQIARDTPLSRAGIIRHMEGRGDPEWFSSTAGNIADYKENLWQQGHEVPVERHAQMPFDNQVVLQKTLGEILPEDDSVQARLATKWAEREIPKLDTLQSADTKIRLLNKEIKTLPETYGPVGVRVRVAAVQALRDQLDTELQQAGETGVVDVNRRWGALNNIENRLRERYFQETGKDARAGILPDWIHAYAFAHPGGVAFGTGLRLGRMFAPDDAIMLGRGMRALSRSGLMPPPIETPEYVGKQPIGLLPGPGGTYTDVGTQAPGGPNMQNIPLRMPGQTATRALPAAGETGPGGPDWTLGAQAPGGPRNIPPPIRLGNVPETTSLARRPGSAPTTTLPSSGETFSHNPLANAPSTARPIEVYPAQVEDRLVRELKSGNITQQDVMEMAKRGDISYDAPRRIFRAAQRGVKAPPPTTAKQYMNRNPQ